MKAMILAAGRGARMRPLSDARPKPLLAVGGKPLIQHHVERLAAAGITQLVINVSWLGEQIEAFLGDGTRWGCSIAWSREAEALETAGGIIHALPLLGAENFLVVNGDVWTDYPFAELAARRISAQQTAHLVLVENPPQHPKGDFGLTADGLLAPARANQPTYTYAGLGLFAPEFFGESFGESFGGAKKDAAMCGGKLPLKALLDDAIRRGEVSGELFAGAWRNVGTPEELAALNGADGGSV